MVKRIFGTWCIAEVFDISKPNSNSNAENHEHPVNLRYVNLTMDLVRGVDDFDTREASKRLALVYYRESAADDRLASHNRRKNRYHKHRPVHTFWIKNQMI